MNCDAVHVGVIGCGTVGTGVVRCLLNNKQYMARHLGFPLELARIADVDVRPRKGVRIPRGLMVRDAAAILDDPRIEIVVELVGGTTMAKQFILRAMRQGKHVVTANKALLAMAGPELHRAAQRHNVDLYYEASVGGGIPIIKAIREGFVANRIDSLAGIVNGTCNYILTRMTEEGLEFNEALDEARAKGYAEANPSLDIEGFDARHKIGILSSLAFGQWIPQKGIYTEGITGIAACDILCAREQGYTIKLLAIAQAGANGISVRVHPTLLNSHSMLANVGGAFNAIEVNGYPVGTTLFYGRGAGMDATSSAVVADIVDIARNIGHASHKRLPAFTFVERQAPLLPIEEVEMRYYLRCTTNDRPGVIARIARELGDRAISISSVGQHEPASGRGWATVIFMTYKAREGSVREAVKAIDRSGAVRSATRLVRVEEDPESQ